MNRDMIKVLIVDDEMIIRKGIRTSIDWERLGIEIVGEAKNGQEALELSGRMEPDIVMTDIRMPVMDGLALAAALRERQPQVKIIIVSGYDDFDYARQALKIGVSEYLTKPVGAEDLTKLMLKLGDQIHEERDRSYEERNKGMLLRESLPFIQSKWLLRLLQGEAKLDEEMLDRARQLQIMLEGPEYAVAVVDIDDYLLLMGQASDREKELLMFALYNVADELLTERYPSALCQMDESSIAILLNVNRMNRHRILTMCEELSDCIRRFVKVSVTIGIGSVVPSLHQVNESMLEALNALSGKAYRGKGQVIAFQPGEHADHDEPVFVSAKEEAELLQSLTALDTAGIQDRLDTWFRHFAEAGASYPHVRSLCVKLIVLATNHVEQMGVQRSELEPVLLRPYEEVHKYETIFDLRSWVGRIFDSFVDHLTRHKTGRYRNIVAVAIQYMQEHYAQDLKLEDVAGQVYVTPNYFSRVFKEETGEHFSEWLNKLRVEKAKQLLKDVGLKVYEVAERVGYNDYKYFAHIFKKYTGITPKQYRNEL